MSLDALTTAEKKALTFSATSDKVLFSSEFRKQMKKKCSAVKKLFGVDDELLLDVEAKMENPSCSNLITIPGRLFIMTNHVLFFTEVFGTIQKIVIQKSDVIELRRRNDSLVIETKDHQTRVFLPLGKNKDLIFERFRAIENLDSWGDSRSSEGSESDRLSTEEESDDDGGFEWISRAAAKEDGFLHDKTEMQELINIELPVGIKKFFSFFLQDDKFFTLYHERRGDTEVIGSPWKEDTELGNVRQFQWRSKVNAPFGPSSTTVNDIQRYYLKDPNHLIFETISNPLDVQYGDSFRVEANWNVAVLSNDKVKLTISVGVAFLKKIHMPGVTNMIRSRAIEESKSSFTLWVDLATEEIERREKESPNLEEKSTKSEKRERSLLSPKSRASATSTSFQQKTPATPPTTVLPPASPTTSSSQSAILIMLGAVVLLCLMILRKLSSIEALILMSPRHPY